MRTTFGVFDVIVLTGIAVNNRMSYSRVALEAIPPGLCIRSPASQLPESAPNTYARTSIWGYVDLYLSHVMSLLSFIVRVV